MLEYPFFSEAAASRFLEVLEAHSVPYETESTDDGPACIRLDEDAISDEIADRLDSLYDELLESADFLGDETSLDKDLAGFEVALSDGTRVTVPIDTDIMKKLTSALSIEEIQSLLAAVANAVETRDTRPLCHFDQQTDSP
ncbi:MAG TPA: hypothetical protein ENK53_07215 [Thiotrichales bacterium]|nr:hypothetical protein [Thiotrichales bacterium]